MAAQVIVQVGGQSYWLVNVDSLFLILLITRALQSVPGQFPVSTSPLKLIKMESSSSDRGALEGSLKIRSCSTSGPGVYMRWTHLDFNAGLDILFLVTGDMFSLLDMHPVMVGPIPGKRLL